MNLSVRNNTVLGSVTDVLIGVKKPYTRHNTFSAIEKKPQIGPIWAEKKGFIGDEQADLTVHGGLEKALHAYPLSHYQEWRQELSGIDPKSVKQPAQISAPYNLLQAGGFGENLCLQGLTEKDIYLNDKLQIGTAIVEVSQGRQPCWKLNDRFNIPDMARRVQHNLRTGWYFRVLEPGYIQAGEPLYLLDRPYPNWSVHTLMAILYHKMLDPVLLQQACTLPLGDRWQKTLQKRLEKMQVEDWQKRVEGPPQ